MNELQHLAKPKDGPAPRWFHIAVATSMIISAVAALVATLHTGRTMTLLVEQNAKLVRAQSTPVLEYLHGNGRDDGTASLDFTLTNVGTGLARIVWFELKLDGKAVKHMGDAVIALSPELKSELAFNTTPVSSRVLAAGSEQRFVGWKKPEPSQVDLLQAWNSLNKARFSRLTVEACFCSVFEECWTSKLNGEVPKPVTKCSPEGRVTLQG